MSYQPLPYAKRQKLTFDSPNLRPPPAVEPVFFEPSDFSAPTSHSLTNNNSHHHPKQSKSRPPIHGNFFGYYTRRWADPNELDPRLALLPKEWIEGKKVLDVGCNSGMVTVEIAQRFQPWRVTGVDIDDELIRLAKRHAELAWSRQAPLPHILDAAEALTSTSHAHPPHDALPSRAPLPEPRTSTKDVNYFPLSLPRMFGYLPSPKELLTTYVDVPEVETVGVTRRGKRKVMPIEIKTFPENLRFKAADWPNEEIEPDRGGYDVIVAFSVTKWIHLHTLNAGLLTFFTRCFESLLPGGRLILEPQPFSTYAKSARLSDELKANYDKLREGEGKERGWKDEDGDFERVLLEQIGFEKKEALGETGKNGFRRPVDVYYKRGGSWV